MVRIQKGFMVHGGKGRVGLYFRRRKERRMYDIGYFGGVLYNL
jgi:hypothetical protein